MIRRLHPSLFQEGKPLSAANWNRLVDGSEELARAFTGEHTQEGKHTSVVIEKAFIHLEWLSNTWGSFASDRLTLTQSLSQGQSHRLTIDVEPGLFLGRDYMGFGVTNMGSPIVISGTRTPTTLRCWVESPLHRPAVKEAFIILYGRGA